MALETTSVFVVASSAIVFILAGVMAYLGLKSYRTTGNERLLFVVLAFGVFMLKSVVIGVNDFAVKHIFFEHHTALFFAAVFDVIIVALLVVPFLAPRRR